MMKKWILLCFSVLMAFLARSQEPSTINVISSDSYTLGIKIDTTYDINRLRSIKIYVGPKRAPFSNATLLSGTTYPNYYRFQMSSAFTRNLTGLHQITVTVIDTEFGQRSYILGYLNFVKTASSGSGVLANPGVDVEYILNPNLSYALSSTMLNELAKGKSAYEVALGNGFEGTEAEWLASFEVPKDTAVLARNQALTYKNAAANSAVSALTSQNAAATSASSATTQAGISTTQAGISTTQATAASNSAAAALASQNAAATSASNAASTLSNAALKSNNLSDLGNAATARTNLGLGSLATQSGTFTAKADLASPTFTGAPTLPTGTIGVTQSAGNSTTALATTAFVTTANNLKANIASPTFTGTVTIPTLSSSNSAVIQGLTIGKGGGSGTSNTAFGISVLDSNISGTNNTGLGIEALRLNQSSFNTALGAYSLRNLRSGGSNTGIGRFALSENVSGSHNIGVGRDAGRFIADGTTSVTVANNSIFLGSSTKALADNQNYQIVIGYNTTGLGDSTTRVGSSATKQTHLNGTLTVGTGTTPSATAIVDFQSTTKGLLMPRMSTTQRNAISSPATGLTIYNTSTNKFNTYNGLIWVSIESSAVNSFNVSTSPLGTVSNCTVVIDNDVNLSGSTATLVNVTLKFSKGKKITNGTLAGTYTIEASDYDQLFDTTLMLNGTCRNAHLSVRWFGASGESLYAPDATYTFLYNDGVDDTPAINHTLEQCRNLGGGKVYLPGGKGAYWVRSQTLYANQEATQDHGDYYAIKLFDNTTLYGDGESSRIMVVDYMVAADYHATNPLYRTRGAIGFAPWTDEELTAAGILTEINTLGNRYRKLGRNNVVVRDLNINCRVSKHPSSDVLFYSIIGVIYGVRIDSEDYLTHARGYQGNIVTNCYFYDVAVAALIKNFNYSSEEIKVVKRTVITNNHIKKTSNKAVEIASSNESYVSENIISESDGGLQVIMGSQFVTFSENSITDGEVGINVTHGCSNIKIINNRVTDCHKPLLIRIDSPLVTTELICENILVSGNDFFQKETTTFLYLFAFEALIQQNNTGAGFLRVRNVVFTNNNFKGNVAKLGVDDVANRGGSMAWAVEGLKFSGNKWDCNVEIVESVTQSGSRPVSTVKDVDFGDDVMAGKTLSIKGDVSDIKFWSNKIKGTVTADATARGRIVFSETDFETGSSLTIQAGSLYLLDVISSSATVNLTGATIVVDRRL